MNENSYFKMSFEEKVIEAEKAIEGQPNNVGKLVKMLDEQIDFLKDRDPYEKVEVDLLTLVCLMRHFNAYFEQNADERPLNFAESCTFCPAYYLDRCKLYPLINITPAAEATGMRVRLGRSKPLSSRQG